MNNSLLSWLNSDTTLGLIRNVVLALGASLVTNGVLTQQGLNDGVGAIIVILGIVLSAISNHSKAQAKAIVAAVEAHPMLTIIPGAQTVSGAPKIVVGTK